MTSQNIVVVGNNLSAFLIAIALDRQNHKVTLVETGTQFNFHSSQFQTAQIEAVPSDPLVFEALAWLEQLVGSSQVAGEEELAPVVLEGGQPKPFLGFGDAEYKSIAPLSQFNFRSALSLARPLGESIQDLRESFKGEVISYSEVTGSDYLDEKIQSITLNGNQKIEADFFVFTEHPKEFLAHIPADVVGTRVRGRVAKTPVWSQVRVVFHHNSELFLSNHILFMLPPSIRNEPFVGQFKVRASDDLLTVGAEPQVRESVWASYFDSEFSEDTEAVSAMIKFMKKHLQKTFSAEEFLKEQSIVVSPYNYADFAWAENGKALIGDIKNVQLGSPLFAPYVGPLASFVIAYQATQAIQEKLVAPEAPKGVSTPSLLSSSEVAL